MIEILMGSALLTVIVLALSLVVLGARAALMPKGDIRLTVNGKRELTAKAGQKLLGILSENGISLPSTCGGVGTCGLCRVTIPDGGGEPLPTEVTMIPARDVRGGMRLACQVVVRRDLAIDVPEDIFDVISWDCTVTENHAVAPFIKELVLELPKGVAPDFRAGAFMQVTAPPYELDYANLEIAPLYEPIWQRFGLSALKSTSDTSVTRAYSLANRAADTNRIVLNIRLALPPPGSDAPPGLVSSYLFGLTPGDTVKVAGPFGSFGAKPGKREMVVIGGGVGMAPLRAIISDQLERVRTDRKITFWYGARSLVELYYRDEFDSLHARYQNFDWTVALSAPRPEDNWTGPTGLIHNVIYDRYLKDHPAPEDCEYYLCGPPLMTKAVFAMLENLGVERSCIFNDNFGG